MPKCHVKDDEVIICPCNLYAWIISDAFVCQLLFYPLFRNIMHMILTLCRVVGSRQRGKDRASGG